MNVLLSLTPPTIGVEIAVWLGAVLVGLSLGLLGSGGAILTVPILVYLVGHDEKTAIVESLAIVGAIALVGTLRAYRERRVDIASALLLGGPGIVGTLVAVWLAQWVSGAVQLLTLGILMCVAAFFMLRPQPEAPVPAQDARSPHPPPRYGLAITQGLGLGGLTGFVGVGGGFLIVPVLVFLRRLPMSVAVGTSLSIITLNTAAGVIKHLVRASLDQEVVTVDWGTVGLFGLLGIGGSVVGAQLVQHLPQRVLRRIFALFLIVMGIYIAIRQGQVAFRPAPVTNPMEKQARAESPPFPVSLPTLRPPV